jgi:hypothetical protein
MLTVLASSVSVADLQKLLSFHIVAIAFILD